MRIQLRRLTYLTVAIIAAGVPPATQGQNVEDAYNVIRNRAVAEKAKGDLKGAIADFGKAIKFKPDDAEAYNNRGLAEYAKGDWKRAIADFSKAIQLQPDYAGAYNNRAASKYANGDSFGSRVDEAKATDLKKARSASPSDEQQLPDISWDAKNGLSIRIGVVGNAPPPDIALATCSTSQPAFARREVYRAYTGCALPRGQVAILNLKGTRATYVDGVAAYNVPPDAKAIWLSSGDHAGERKPGAPVKTNGNRHDERSRGALEKGDYYSEYYLDNSDSLELLPGRHTIRFVLRENTDNRGDELAHHPAAQEDNRMVNSPGLYLEQDIDVEAGKTYTAIARTQATGRTTDTYIGPANNAIKYSTTDSQFWVEIAEFNDYPAAYLQMYEEDVKNGDSARALSALESYLLLFPNDSNYKAVEEMARKFRTSLDKTQLDAYRASNRGPHGPAAQTGEQTLPASSKILGCAPEMSRQPQPQERTAPPMPSSGRARNGQAPPNLDLVLSRAAHYVEEYEAQLGNLIGEEVYVQNEAPVKMRPKLVTMFPSPKSKEQRTESDFAILQVGKEWIGLREVNCLDGIAVQSKTEDLQKVLDDSPTDVVKALNDISRESARYNIGSVQRNTNLPTFALQILRPSNVRRFEFKKAGETIVSGIRTWAVGFREIQGPTIVHGLENHDEFSDGTLWIEPETGRVLKTEMNVAGREGQTSFRGQMVVSYKNNPKLEMWVPIRMVEHYDTNGVRSLDCQADYFNFHRFQVDTHFDFGPQIPADDGPSFPAPASPAISVAPVRPATPPTTDRFLRKIL